MKKSTVAILLLAAASLPCTSVAAQVAQHKPRATSYGSHGPTNAITGRANPFLESTTIIAGAVASFPFDNVKPGGAIGLAYSLIGNQPDIVSAGPCGLLKVPLQKPTLQGLATANSNGEAIFYVNIPPIAYGKTVYLQALDVERCTLSNATITVVDGPPSKLFIDMLMVGEEVEVKIGNDLVATAILDADFTVDTVGKTNGNGNARIEFSDGSFATLSITNDEFVITSSGTTIDFRSTAAGGDRDVLVNGVLIPLDNIIYSFITDATSGNTPKNWSVENRIILAAMAFHSSPAWRANSVAAQNTPGAPSMWCRVSTITSHAGLFTMTSQGCGVLDAACSGKEAIAIAGISFLSDEIRSACSGGGLDAAIKCYAYILNLWG